MGGIIGKFIGQELADTASARTAMRNGPKNSLMKFWSGSDTKIRVTEAEIMSLLSKKFPNAAKINVRDKSGGCGEMFEIYVETDEFRGLTIMKQHRSVYDALEAQIKKIHGLHVITKVAE